jgi:hypothetical protein
MRSVFSSKWVRTDRQSCPICGRKGWCSISEGAVLCMRQASDHPVKVGTATGWIHRLDSRSSTRTTTTTTSSKPTTTGLTELTREYRSNVIPGDLATVAGKLGVSLYRTGT